MPPQLKSKDVLVEAKIIRFIYEIYEKDNAKRSLKGINKLNLVMQQLDQILKELLGIVGLSCKDAEKNVKAPLEEYMVTMLRFMEQFYFLIHTISSNNLEDEKMSKQIEQISNFQIFTY